MDYARLMARRVFITVAEVSGDRHAAQFITALRELDPTLIIEGLGGPEMAAAGATIHHETVGNAAMGWRGALRAFEVHEAARGPGGISSNTGRTCRSASIRRR